MTFMKRCGPTLMRWWHLSLLTGLLSVGLSLPASAASLSDTTWDALFRVHGAHVPEYDWRWLKAQAWQESRFDPAAVSPAGAIGLMQIMPGTGRDLSRRLGIEGPLTSPAISVLYGAVYMRWMIDIWHSPRPRLERLKLAHASYNAGVGNILAAQGLAGGALLWADIELHLPDVTGHHAAETRGYVRLIRKWYGELVCFDS